MGKLLFYFYAALSVFIISCNSEQKRNALINEAKESAIDSYISSLSEEVKISQLFLVNIEGNESFHPVEKTGDIYSNKGEGEPLVPGGCLLFGYNIGKTKEQITSFTSSIKEFYVSNNNVPPYVAVDQEGGYVNRLRGITERFPSSKEIAEKLTGEEAQQLYQRQALQMAELGITMNLAPVVEVETEYNAAFLDTRSFGSLEQVLKFGQLEINCFESQKVGTVLKHFPGNSNTDPHTGLPELMVTKEQLEEQYTAPFKALLPFSSAVLMSHARVKVVDDESFDSSTPACLSEFWVTHFIRNECGFEGLILSDDIFMGALADNGFPPEKAAVQAVEAGIDVIMLSEKRFAKVASILLKKASESPEFVKKIDSAAKRVVKYKIKTGILELKEDANILYDKKNKISSFTVNPVVSR